MEFYLATLRRPAALAMLLLLSACGAEQAQTSAAPVDLIVHCGRLIDGLSATGSEDRSVVIRGQRIARIAMTADIESQAAETLDLREYTCLPGLIDTHVHFDIRPEDADDYTVYLRRTPEDTQQLAADNAKKVLLSGFTTVRHVGSYLQGVDTYLRERIDAGALPGPRMQVAGPYLTIPHGGGDMYIPGIDDSEIPDYYRAGVARGPDQFRARAERNIANGADFLKVIASGAVFGHGGVVGAREMTYEEIKAVVDVASAAGIKVTAHAHGADSIKDAIRAGVSSIEHASLADDEAIELALQNDVAFSMDVYNGTYTEEVGHKQNYAEEFMQKNEETTEAQRIVFEKAVKAGVTILFGTDLGVLPYGMSAWQFAIMVERGMTPMQAIMSATSVAAEHMDMADDVGALQVGRYADIIAVTGDPLEDVTTLRDVPVVIKAGAIIKNEPTTAGRTP